MLLKAVGPSQREPAGIHSGDSYAVLPPYNLGDLVMQQIIEHTNKIALALNTVGLINIQFGSDFIGLGFNEYFLPWSFFMQSGQIPCVN